MPEDEIRSGFWRLHRDTIFPETVLLADTEKQNYSIYPRKYYVDALRSCRSCFLVDDAVYPIERAVLKNLSNVGAVKNRAMKAIPEYPGIVLLVQAVRPPGEIASSYAKLNCLRLLP